MKQKKDLEHIYLLSSKIYKNTLTIKEDRSNTCKNFPGTRVHRATVKVTQIEGEKNVRHTNKDNTYLYLFRDKYLIQLAAPGTKHSEGWDLLDNFLR